MNGTSQLTTSNGLLGHKELKKMTEKTPMHRYLRAVEELDDGKHLRHHYVEWFKPRMNELANKRVSNVNMVTFKSLTKVRTEKLFDKRWKEVNTGVEQKERVEQRNASFGHL